MGSDNIIKWCDKHTYLVSLLKKNFDDFLKNEVPNTNLKFEDIRTIQSNNTCVTKLLDKYLFILAMMSPTSIYNLLTDKICKLRTTMDNLVGVRHNNNNQIEYILGRFDDRFIHQYLK